MKLIFLDIDGVLNCAKTSQRHRGVIGIDPYMVAIFNRIIEATGARIVISSSWRHSKDGLDEIRQQVMDFIGVTPIMPKRGGVEMMERGHEIAAWIEKWNQHVFPNPPNEKGWHHEHIEKYVIIDDDSDMLPEQQHCFFKTTWLEGLTEEIAKKIIDYLKD